ncbi:unnamed protein product [Fusarium equiseti]|uniref:Uncharacterized protein n=1 Tax=Fusarium equiseti TaxID=61235 RepID=A0A8J2IY27_FUSEQ|nr:unnamed protein product [Fusarium equiseti]
MQDATDISPAPSANSESNVREVPSPVLPSILAMEPASPDLTMLPVADALHFARAVVTFITALMLGMNHYVFPLFRLLMVVAYCYLKALASIPQSLELLSREVALSIIIFFSLLLLICLIHFACRVWWFVIKCAIEIILWPLILISLAIACQYVTREWASSSMSIGRLLGAWKFPEQESSDIYLCLLKVIYEVVQFKSTQFLCHLEVHGKSVGSGLDLDPGVHPVDLVLEVWMGFSLNRHISNFDTHRVVSRMYSMVNKAFCCGNGSGVHRANGQGGFQSPPPDGASFAGLLGTGQA